LAFSRSEEQPSVNGQIMILRSRDGQAWRRAGVVDTPVDDAHPHLLGAGGELRLYFTQYRRPSRDPKTYDHATVRPMLARSIYGYQWSEAVPLAREPLFFYRPRLHEGRYYVAAHNRGASSLDDAPQLAAHVVTLLESDDGVTWNPVGVI